MRLKKVLGMGLLMFGVAAVNAYSFDNTAISKLKPERANEKAPAGDPPGAAAAFGNTCADGGDAGLLAATGGTLGGDNSAGTNDFGDAGVTNGQDPAGCNEGAGWGAGGLDQILSFTVDTTGPWTFTTCPGFGNPGQLGPAGGFSFDSSLMVLEDAGGGCPGDFFVACNGDGGGNCGSFESELVDISLTAGTTYYLLVDAWSVSTAGAFSVAFHGPCSGDQDCTDRDNDLFCTGTETCGADGLCVSSGFPCSGATPVCDEEARECVSCAASPDPAATCGDDGDPCNGIEFCNDATGGCEVRTACPDGDCQNGTCQDPGLCQFAGTACRVGADCPFNAAPNFETCDLPGTGTMRRCWDGHSALGPNEDCQEALVDYGPNRIDHNTNTTNGEVCVPDGTNEAVTCVHEDCWVYAADTSGYFGSPDAGEWFADDRILNAAPAGRDVVSHSVVIICRDGTGSGGGVGPYDITTALWTSVTTDPNVDPNAGLPDVIIPGTTCFFPDNPCGNAIAGDPNRNTIIEYICQASGGTLIDNVPGGIDDWQGFVARHVTDVPGDISLGFNVSGAMPLSQGVFAGNSLDLWGTCDTNGGDCQGGIGWGLTSFGGSPFLGNHAGTICTAVVGTCCLGVAGCEMLTEEDCASQGGSFLGENTVFTPEFTCDETGDGDGVADLCDNCPNTDNISQADCDSDGEGDACEASENDQDGDFDGTCNGVDGCPTDPNKSDPGQCGCFNVDDDTDKDGTADCNDGCINDPAKIAPGVCGCNVADQGDEDNDGVLDCVDQCRGVDDAVFAPECDGAIPTVSEWGLVILALLLLAAGKVYFGRRTVAG